MRNVVLIEYNELAAPLLSKFMALGELPNFRRFYDRSTVYTTTAGDAPLEPWVQWPSIHCGVPYAEHRAFHLGDGRRVEQKAIGTVLSEHGIAVGIFGTINTNYAWPSGYHMPDPWDAREYVHPVELTPFYDFVSRQVRENTRELGMSARDAATFAWFMMTHGLSASTVVRIVSQLLVERVRPQLRWRRAVMLDLLQYDLFRHLNRRYGVRFAALFLNSTAHFQHYFWRDMEPAGFSVPPESSSDPSLRDAILFGYRAMDDMLGRMMKDYRNERLIMCTGLSQEPWFETTKTTYRPIDFERFLRFAGILQRVRVAPAMAERFRLECDTAADARETKSALDRLEFRGKRLMSSSVDGSTVYTGCGEMSADAGIYDETVLAGPGRERFGNLLYRTTGVNSGLHHHEGSLWIRDGEHRVVEGLVPIESIAPTILAHFGIDALPTMRAKILPPSVSPARLKEVTR